VSGTPIRLVRAAQAPQAGPDTAEHTLRTIARQQEAVAHLGHQALAGAALPALMDEAVASVARGLDVERGGLLEFRPENRTLVLRAGVGWNEGWVNRAIIPGDGDTHAGYALRCPTPVVIEDLRTERRFDAAPLLNEHAIISGISVVIQGADRAFGLLGGYTASRRDFSIHDVHYVQAMANVLATALARSRTEEALRQSEQHFRSLIDNASDIVTILSHDGIFRFTSPSVQRLLGYAPHELLERSAFDFVHPDDLPAVAEAMTSSIRDPGTSYAAEFRFRHKDGTWRVLESVGQVRAGPHSGEPASFIVNARDVTERLAQERALRANKERLRTVVAVAPLVLFALDKDGIFTLVEGKGLESLGVRPAQLVGQSVFNVYADLPQLLADFRRALAGESFSSTVEVFGQVFEAWYSPIRDGNGAVAGVTGVATDVTERHRAEDALRRSEESSRALVQHATYGIFRSTSDGRFLAVNPALVRMLGYQSEAEVLGLSISRDVYANPEERARILERFAESETVQGVVEWKRRNGERILVRLSGHAVRRPDRTIDCIETMAEDITSRRLLEEQLRQSQKIEALGQLTGGIAHDFNNLLTIILANAELIRKSLGADKQEEQADLRDLISAALRGRAMVKELLGFARRQSLDLAPLDLGGVIADIAGMLRRVLPADIEVIVSGDAGVLPDVRCDVHAIEQIVLNLVTNARDAMPSGGVLRIETARADLRVEEQAAAGVPPSPIWVRLSVEDTGNGMDQATLERVFEPFFTTKPSGKGTGLGMATVYSLVKQLGGVIKLESAPARGTRVKVFFPGLPPSVEPPRRRLSGDHHVQGGDETILLVEDEDDVRRAAKRVLEQAGYRVLTAADGQEGLEILRQQPKGIHLTISDLVMPRLGGRAFYEAARREGYETPFLFASGYSPEDGRGDLPAEPGLPMLHKPWTPADLLARVRELLDK